MRDRIKSKRKYILIIIFFAIFFISSVLILQQFVIKTIMIISKQPKLNGLSILNNQNLINIKIPTIANFLKQANPKISQVKINKKYPSTIIIETEDRIPIAQLGASEKKLYIDEDGIIFNSEENYSGLPIINLSEISISKENKADWRVSKIIPFVRGLIKSGINIEQISQNDLSNNYLVKLVDGVEVFIPYNADFQLQASSLQLIIVRFRIEGKNIQRVDFRFDKPIVTLVSGEKISSSF